VILYELGYLPFSASGGALLFKRANGRGNDGQRPAVKLERACAVLAASQGGGDAN